MDSGSRLTRKSLKKVILIAVVAGGLILWLIAIRGCLGHSATGVVGGIRDVPLIGPHISLNTEGPVSFALTQNTRGFAVYIAGRTSLEALEEFCGSEPGLELDSWGGCTEDYTRALVAMGVRHPEDFGCQFGEQDPQAYGFIRSVGPAHIRYRKADGRFLMQVVRWYEKVR